MYMESVSFCVLNRQKLRTVDYYRLLILSGDFFSDSDWNLLDFKVARQHRDI